MDPREAPTALSDRELERVLTQAREEQWTELALIGRGRIRLAKAMVRNGWPPSRLFLIPSLSPQRARGIAAIASLESLVIAGEAFRHEPGWLGDGARALASLERLRSLRLDRNGIGSTGARALASLGSLTCLRLDGNAIGPDGARAIASLGNLTSLHLGGNAIGPDGARAIASLGNLTSLHLGGTGIGPDGARAIASLVGLTSLHLADNLLWETGACALSSLTNLVTLHLGNNGIGVEGAQAIARLERLTSLHLPQYHVAAQFGAEGARAIASLVHLTTLDLHNNGIGTEGARAIASLGRLTSLDLSNNELGDAGAEAIACLVELTSLDLAANDIGAAGVRALVGFGTLDSLDLSGNALGDDGAKALAALGSLTALRLRGSAIGDEGARALAALDNLVSLELSHNQIGDDGAGALARLVDLTSLHLRHNRLGRDGARALASLGRLTTLDLDDNSIGDEGARALAGLTSLAALHVERNDIGDEGACALAGLPKLASLHLVGNRVTQSSLFRSAPRLDALSLSANPVGDAPPSLLEHNCLPALQAYWHDLDQGATTNDSVMVVLLGNSGVGKTTLARRLAQGNTTPEHGGRRLQSPRCQRCELALPGGDRLDARIVDCGSDLPYPWSPSTVHCIVLVVWTQGSDAEPGKWLQDVIQLVGMAHHEGRLIFVENRFDEPRPPAGSSEPEHREPKPGAPDRITVSAIAPHGLDELRSALAEVAERTRSPWIHPIPTSWHAVRRTLDEWRDPAAHGLDARARSRLERREFDELCSAHGIASADVVARFLFDTDVLLDRPRRSEPIDLNPLHSGRTRADRRWYSSTPLVDARSLRDRSRFPVLSDREVLEVLAQAREERWTELALVHGSRAAELELEGWPRSRILVDCRLPLERARDIAAIGTLRSLVLDGGVEPQRMPPLSPALADAQAGALASLGSLVDLRSLVLYQITIGAPGARAIASLPSLTSLVLESCFIGREGACALAALTNLTSLALPHNGIEDEGVQALAALTSLTSLALAWNNVRNDGAKALAALAELTSLDLDGHEIGVEGVEALAGLPRLATLRLCSGGFRMTGLEADAAQALARATSLTSLHLGRNQLGNEGARAIASLAGLTSLDLGSNGIGDDGARALADLRHLTSLHLGHNQIGAAGAEAIASLVDLTCLHLEHNELGDDGARALAALPHLTSLHLEDNGIGDAGASALASLGSLTSLDLTANEIGDAGAEALTSLGGLTSLDLGGNEIGDDGARALACLTTLTSLDLGGNHVGDEGIAALASLSRLTSLRLSDNGLRATAGEPLASLAGLSVLDLDDNDLRAEGAAALARHGGLTSLRLRGNQIGDEGAKALAGLGRLASLHIESNGIGDDGARALAALGNLTSLDLQRNGITNAGIFRSMPWLESLHLGDNPILDVYGSFIGTDDSLPDLTAYWHDLDQGATTNDAVTVLVLGEAGVGKTTLVHWLVHGHAPPEPVGERVLGPGLQCFALTLPDGCRIDLRIRDCEPSKGYLMFARPDVVVRVWARERHDASTTSHTLDVGRAAEEGRLLVVENRFDASSDLPPEDHALPQLPAAPRVVVGAATGTAIDELRAALTRVIESSRARWAYSIPASWRTVRVTLDAWRDPAAYGLAEAPLDRITQDRFDELCAAHGVADPQAVVRYLLDADVVSRDRRAFDMLRLIPPPQQPRTPSRHDAAC